MFGKVGGISVYVKYRVAGGVAYLGIRVHGGIFEKPEGVCVRFLHAFLFFRGDGAKGGEHGWVYRNGILKERMLGCRGNRT